MTRALLAALLLAAAPLVSQEAVPPDSERRADLEKLQSRIGTLKSRLAESEKKEATLAEELQRLELRLELATREGELLAATRAEFARRLAAVSQERAAAAVSAAHSREALLARARLLQRFGRFGYFRVLLEARDVPALLDSIERLDGLARRDGKLLLRYRQAETRLQDDLAREEALKAEIDRLYAKQPPRRGERGVAERSSASAFWRVSAARPPSSAARSRR